MQNKFFLEAKKSISKERKKQLEDFCKPLNVRFKNILLLDLAFHHRSYSNENQQLKRYNNERLEFLGDSVLGLVAASFLFTDMENPEGDLAKIKSNVVSEKALAPIALKFGIDKCLIMGRGEELTGGRTKPAILADAVEAVIGAIYIDSGFEEAKNFVLSFLVDEIRKVQNDLGSKDYKSLLQELVQKKFKCVPSYSTVKTIGPDHDRTFFVTCTFNGATYGPAEGKNKKNAEQNAAKLAWELLE